jgi:iron complex outermembrane recepter protein
VVYHGTHLSIDADAYKIDFSNKFATDPTAPASEGTVYINEGSVQYKGLEGQVTYAFPHGIAVFGNASRNYAKTDNPGQPQRQVANAPEWTAAGGVIVKHGPIRFSLIDKWIGKQWFVDPTTATDAQYAFYKSNGYNTAILSLRYDIGPVRVGFEVNNLFDSQKVQNIGAASKTPVASYGVAGPNNFDQYYYQTGRAYTGDITITF